MRNGSVVRVINRQELLNSAFSENNKKNREIALNTIETLFDTINPKKIIESKVKLLDNFLCIEGRKFDLTNYRKIIVVGGGKASGSMAEALENILENYITSGLIVVPKGTSKRYKTKKIEILEASHPIPDNSSVKGAKKILSLVEEVNENDLVICLFSGGGSSLLALPRNDIPLRDKKKVTDMLLKCGATINEINAVRKHISSFKGGQLAKAAYPATVLGILLSDVLGDPLDVIASGPTVPDSTTFKDAIHILKEYEIWEKTPNSIKKILIDGETGLIEETPKKESYVFQRVSNIVLGNNRFACKAAIDALKKHGLKTLFLTSFMEGEAKEFGTMLGAIAREISVSGNPLPPPVGIVVGGETTVTVTGNGKGGRNQEIALSAALMIKEIDNTVIVSISTDGIDGPTDAAGAMVDGETIRLSKQLGLDAAEYLRNNDSYSFFSRVGGLVFTGPTGTNVNDITMIIVS
ncbi:glycerate kinase [Candidatus Bathyarchaeota archaeon]|nr:glycerate kinase [Candidatus Bathyarchaeota archaeon]